MATNDIITEQQQVNNNEITKDKDNVKDEENEVVGLDEIDDNDLSLADDPFSNMVISVREQIIKMGFAKLTHSIVKKQADYLVFGYVRESYEGKQTMPKEFYKIFRNYYPEYHLVCCNPNYFFLKIIKPDDDNDNDDNNDKKEQEKDDDNDEQKNDLYIISKQDCKLSKFLEKLMEDDADNNINMSSSSTLEVVEISKVPSSTLEIVLEYLAHHKGIEPDPLPCPIRSIYMKTVCSDPWDAEFIDGFSKKIIFEIILGANYLEIKGLLHLGSAKIATLIKQMDQQEINRVIEEEEVYRRRNNQQSTQQNTTTATATATDNDNDDNQTNDDETNNDKTTEAQQLESPIICLGGCGFYGSKATKNCCSLCFKKMYPNEQNE